MFLTIVRVLRLLHERRAIVLLLTLSNFIFAGLILLEPIFFREVIDLLISFSGDGSDNYKILLYTLVFWIGVGITTIIIRLFVSIYSDRLAHTEVDRNIFALFGHLLGLSMKFHMDADSGQLVKKITKGVDGMFDIQLNFFRRALPNIFTIIILIPTVLYFNWKLGSFVIIMGIISMIITFFLASRTFKKQTGIEYVYSKISALYGDTFSNMSVVKSFALFSMKNRQLKKLTDDRIGQQFPILVWWGVIVSFAQVLKIIVSIGVIFFGSYLFIHSEISIGEIVMFLSFSMIFLAAIEDLTWTLEGMFWKIAGIKDYFEILDTKIEVQDKKDAITLTKVQGAVSFEKVGFSYDEKRKILKNISLDIKAGEKIAFVGHTGSGKTTMMNLLLRFFEAQQGDIKIDGTSIYDVTQDSLRKNIGVVFQDNSLFNTTILDNIRLDTSDATQKDIDRVIQKSHCIDFIKNLSEGLDTIVGERGVKLSGGEKQRLAIARAFLKDAPILILDEATSALDARTEQYLQASFDELMEGRTTFIIAHRLSTIRKADRIFVFEQGEIIEQGNYQELTKLGGHFSKLVEAQTKGFIE